MSGFPFLSLTREIRDMIYRQCLVVPFLIVPHPTHEERRQSELPLTALLAVSKQVRAEARPILYRKNSWRLPRLLIKGDLFHTVEPWLFRSIDFHLTGLDVPPEVLLGSAAALFYSESENPTIMGTEAEKTLERAKIMHNVYLSQVVKAWDIKVTLLEEFRNLRQIAVNLDYFVCPHGCCRLELFQESPIQRLLELLKDKEPQRRHGKLKVWFDGLYTKEEETLLFEVHGFEDIWANFDAAEEDHSMPIDDTADSDASDNGSGQDPGDDDPHADADIGFLSGDSGPPRESTNHDPDEEDDGSVAMDVNDDTEPSGYDYEILRAEARGR